MMSLPADTYIEHAGAFSQAFVRAADHPVMKGLHDLAFTMWNDGHLICEQAYRRPVKGNFMTLVECGEDASLIWTPLMEVYIGKGSILASQLAIVSHWKTEPMAAEMLLRMLAYLDQPVYRSPQTRLAIVGEASESVKNRLAEIRTNISEKPQPGDVLLVDMAAPRKESRHNLPALRWTR